MKITWHAPTNNVASASFRLRVYAPHLYFLDKGVDSRINEVRIDSDVVVFSKYYDDRAQKLVRLYREKNPNAILVLDLCDNHFYYNESAEYDNIHHLRTNSLIKFCAAVDGVITSSDYLKSVVVKNTEIKPNKVMVIDDPIDEKWLCRRKLNSRLLLDCVLFVNLKVRLSRFNKKSDRVIWFGAHGVPYADSGMTELYKSADILNSVLATDQRKFSLTIVSNSRKKYESIARDFKFRSFYLPWSAFTFHDTLSLHSCCILPITKSPFTLSKSSNRLVTALSHGLSVVSDIIPAYEKFTSVINHPFGTESLSAGLNISRHNESKALPTNFKEMERLIGSQRIEKVAQRWRHVFQEFLNGVCSATPVEHLMINSKSSDSSAQ